MNIPLITIGEELFLTPEESKNISSGIYIQGIRLFPSEKEALYPHLLYLNQNINGSIEFEMFDQEKQLIFSKSISPILPLADMLNLCLVIFNEYVELGNRLKEMTLKNAGLDEYITVFSEIMGNPVYIVDSTYKVLAIDESPIYSEMSAIWRHLTTYRYLSYDIIAKLRETEELSVLDNTPITAIVNSDVFPNAFINCPLLKNGQVAGHLFVVGYNKQITPGKIALADELKQIIEKIIQNNISFLSTRNKGYENFLIHSLTDGTTEPALIHKQLSTLGWDETGNYTVAICQPAEDNILYYENICRLLEKTYDGKPLIYNKQVICVFYLTKVQEYRKIADILENFSMKEKLSIAMSDLFSGFENLPWYYKQAQYTLLYYCMNEPDFFSTYADRCMEYFLSSCPSRKDLEMFCDPSLKMLDTYDKKHGTEYLHTLKTFLLNERNIAITAKSLHIHRNTLLYRIERLNNMLLSDLDQEQNRLRIQISLYIIENQK